MYRSRWSVAGAGGLLVGGISCDDDVGDGESELGGGVSVDPFPCDTGSGWYSSRFISRLRVELTDDFVQLHGPTKVLQSAPRRITVR